VIYSQQHSSTPAICVVAVLTALLTSCATVDGVDDAGSSQSEDVDVIEREEVELAPMLVRGDGEPRSAEEIFESAHSAYTEGKYRKSIREYRLITTHLEESEYWLTSMYNIGLAYEKLEAWKKARRTYRRLHQQSPKTGEGLDAAFRIAAVNDKLGTFEPIIDLMTTILLRSDLSNYDRLEAYYRRSKAHLDLERWQKAAEGFRKLLELNRNAVPSNRLRADTALIVKTYLNMGRCYQFAMSQIELKLPPERMGKDLEKKARLLKSAQKYYFDALRQHHPEWSIAAGYEIGKLYEDFYRDIFTAEIPDKLSDKEIDVYFKELQKKIRPLLERAIKVYRKNIELAERLSSRERKQFWRNRSSRSLHHLKSLRHSSSVKKRAQQLAVAGEPFSKLWAPFDQAVKRVNRAIESAREKLGGQMAQSSVSPSSSPVGNGMTSPFCSSAGVYSGENSRLTGISQRM
jgi:tetratricopeptide (TPR) repeat protein